MFFLMKSISCLWNRDYKGQVCSRVFWKNFLECAFEICKNFLKDYIFFFMSEPFHLHISWPTQSNVLCSF